MPTGRQSAHHFRSATTWFRLVRHTITKPAFIYFLDLITILVLVNYCLLCQNGRVDRVVNSFIKSVMLKTQPIL
jgi:hypothetical protein